MGGSIKHVGDQDLGMLLVRKGDVQAAEKCFRECLDLVAQLQDMREHTTRCNEDSLDTPIPNVIHMHFSARLKIWEANEGHTWALR